MTRVRVLRLSPEPQLQEGPRPPGSPAKAWDGPPVPQGPEDPPTSTDTLGKPLIGHTCSRCVG